MSTNKKERLTNQKKAILDYLKSVKTHPTAEEIYQKVKKKLPRISRGTVYRILNNLKKKNQIQEIITEVSHFDADISSHTHFICQECGKIIDLFDKMPNLKNKKIKVGKIKNYQIIFYGVCKKCKK